MDILKIKKSKTREALFKLYFNNPKKEYYLRELERKIKIPVQNIRRELINLERDGLFLRSKQGNSVFYSLNKNSIIFQEVKKILDKTFDLEGKLKRIIAKAGKVSTAFIFGSYADKTHDFLSDIDIMIVGEINEDYLIEKFSNLESQTEKEINYHIFSKSEFDSRIKEKDFFITKIMLKPKIFLINKDEQSEPID